MSCSQLGSQSAEITSPIAWVTLRRRKRVEATDGDILKLADGNTGEGFTLSHTIRGKPELPRPEEDAVRQSCVAVQVERS